MRSLTWLLDGKRLSYHVLLGLRERHLARQILERFFMGTFKMRGFHWLLGVSAQERLGPDTRGHPLGMFFIGV